MTTGRVAPRSLYTVGVIRDFVAQHFLFGGDFGSENEPHSHAYKMEALFEGDALDQHGFLVDIALVKRALDELLLRFRDKMLNEDPALAGLNPGLEPFARVLTVWLAERVHAPGLTAVSVKLWENAEAFAVCRLELRAVAEAPSPAA